VAGVVIVKVVSKWNVAESKFNSTAFVYQKWV